MADVLTAGFGSAWPLYQNDMDPAPFTAIVMLVHAVCCFLTSQWLGMGLLMPAVACLADKNWRFSAVTGAMSLGFVVYQAVLTDMGVANILVSVTAGVLSVTMVKCVRLFKGWSETGGTKKQEDFSQYDGMDGMQ